MMDVKPVESSVLAFIHIRKTAGISLQRLLAKQYGDRFFGAHGHSAITSPKITRGDLVSLPDHSCVCRHWGMNAYRDIENRCNFVTVFRDPIKRIVSHYSFYRKHHPNGMSIDEYIRQEKNKNIFCKRVDPDKLCEFYLLDSISRDLFESRIINSNDIEHVNRTKDKHRFSRKQRVDFCGLNDGDIQLYQWAKARKR